MTEKTKRDTSRDVIRDLEKVADKKRAISVAQYFKTGKGEYGEGDIFIGVTVPLTKAVAKEYRDLSINEVLKLLKSPIHEHRAAALEILDLQYSKHPERRKEIVEQYLDHTSYINNWDLVDMSARDIIGHFIWSNFSAMKRRSFLKKLARSKSLWERRIAVVATFYGIQQGDLSETFYIAELLMNDTHDLMHKAIGWMLRETGKKDRSQLKSFLSKHATMMPRTMLRYSIEHFSPDERLKYMKMKALSLKGRIK